MCRLLGIISAEPIPYRILLRETRKSLSFLFIASEKMTPEPWVEIEEKTLLKIDRLPKLSWRVL